MSSNGGREGVNEGETEGQRVKVCDDGSTLILLLSLTGCDDVCYGVLGHEPSLSDGIIKCLNGSTQYLGICREKHFLQRPNQNTP